MKNSIGIERSVFVREAKPDRWPRAAASGIAWPPFDTLVADSITTFCAGQITNQTFAHMTLPSMPPKKIFQPYALAKNSRRSEEHTSELQSHHDLVCRLLLA